MDWHDRYENHHLWSAHSVDFEIKPRFVDTCVGTVDTQLYGGNLQRLCAATTDNIHRLKNTLRSSDNSRMKIEITPNGNMRMKGQDEKRRKNAWNDTNVMFTTPDVMDRLSVRDGDSDCENAYVNKFCYLCTSLEEHQRHMLHKREKRPISSKPRIEYIAPRPKVRRKKVEEDAENIHENLYKIDVYTGDVENAGTDANVSITIKGSRDVLYQTKLTKGRGSAKFCFMRGSKETFYLKGPRLGNLEIVTIEHDGLEKKHSWYLEKIEIKDMKTEHIWTFYCQQWLSIHIKDYRIKRDLIGKPQELPLSEYIIDVTTGKKSFAGTDANIFLILFGTQGQSKKIQLVDKSKGKEAFEKGKTDTFVVAMPSLGQLKKIRIEHDAKGFASGWFLDRIVIRVSDLPKQSFYFLYNGWIGKDIGDGKLFREIKAQKHLPKEITHGNGGVKTKYIISVLTGDVRFAGTDADVFIQLFGEKGTTKKLTLDDEKNNFERNMLDSFEIEAVDVGTITKILIGHDNSGPGAGWYLEEVTIRRYLSKPEVVAYLKKAKREMNKKKIKKNEDGDDSEMEDLQNNMRNMGRRNSRKPSTASTRRRPSSARSMDSKRSSSTGERRNSRIGRKKREKESVSDTSSSESESDSEDDDRMRSKLRRNRRRNTSEYYSDSDDERKSKRKTNRKRHDSKYYSDSDDDDRKSKRRRDRKQKDAEYYSDSDDDNRKSKRRTNKKLNDSDIYSDSDDYSRSKRRTNKKQKGLVYKVPLYEDYYFTCRKWFAKDEGDGLFERELEVRNKEMFYKD